MSTNSEKVNAIVKPLRDTETKEGKDTSTLQQLKAKKNKSNLFLIKSYSFIEKTNNNNNTSNINNNNNNSQILAKMSTVSAPSSELLKSPDLEPFPDIGKLMLAQMNAEGAEGLQDAPTKKTRQKKAKKQKQPKQKTKTKRNKADDEQETEQIILRRKIHEYEELLQHLPPTHSTLPRPQSLPAKVHFETAAATNIESLVPPIPPKRLGANIKRESFLRQSLQSIRRSFGSNKHASKLPTSPLPSPNGSSNASTTSSTVSSSSCFSASAIGLLSKAQAQNHLLDEFLPTPVVLLLNDDLMAGENQHMAQDSDIVDGVAIRSANSVSAAANGGNSGNIDERATSSMAPLQLPQGATATTSTNNSSAAAATTTLNEQQQQQLQLQQRRLQFGQQFSLPETFGPEDSSLPQSYASSSAVPLQLSGSAHSLSSSPSPSPRSSQSHKSNSNPNQGQGNGLTAGKGSNTAKQHEQQASAFAAISSTSAAAGAAANVAATSAAAAAAAANATPPEKEKDKEKEKKRKEVSSSRVKKFHRHFSQVSKDEKLINYFSCALVGDIPLQGHLYITEEHFAFYSNVFGYVTKVVIPTSSVTKISKEKTAKIIPNAVGVATADERYVFGSFISRESAFRLMCTVCIQLANGTEILPKPLPVDMELTEEYLLDDDSSCSISGNESPPQLRDATAAAANSASTSAAGNAELRQRNIAERHSDVLAKSKLDVSLDQMIIRSSAPPVVHYEDSTLAAASVLILNGAGANLSNSTSANASAASSSGPASSSSSPITVVGVSVGVGVSGTPATTTTAPRSRLGGLMHSARSHLSLRLPTLTELHVLYLGIMLAIMLALFSVFLLYRILDIEAKTSLYNTPIDFHLRSGNDEDIFAEALRWQKELQDKSTAEAQHILSKNLEQISKVRRSLETLSMLIHDRRAGYAQSENIREAEAELDPSQISVSNDISV